MSLKNQYKFSQNKLTKDKNNAFDYFRFSQLAKMIKGRPLVSERNNTLLTITRGSFCPFKNLFVVECLKLVQRPSFGQNALQGGSQPLFSWLSIVVNHILTGYPLFQHERPLHSVYTCGSRQSSPASQPVCTFSNGQIKASKSMEHQFICCQDFVYNNCLWSQQFILSIFNFKKSKCLPFSLC